jgi:ADP-ribose pyrophosphatase YjhB (NUDIX family)
VLLIDARDRVLLFKYRGQEDGPFWATIGGGLDPGESYQDAARRELFEETGFRADLDLGEPAYVRDFLFEWGPRTIHSLEQHFVVRTDAWEVRDEDFREMWAPEGILTHGWWSVDELRSTEEVVFPQDLADRLTVILATT